MSFDRRIVFDTGVLVSAALRPASVPALALEKGFLNFDVCVSQATLAELCEVLMRKKFAAYATELMRHKFVAGFTERAVLFDVRSRVSDCVDEKDNKFLELALDCDAELIVASDAHLTTLHPWRNIRSCRRLRFWLGYEGSLRSAAAWRDLPTVTQSKRRSSIAPYFPASAIRICVSPNLRISSEVTTILGAVSSRRSS
jgi:uncharacterized protein